MSLISSPDAFWTDLMVEDIEQDKLHCKGDASTIYSKGYDKSLQTMRAFNNHMGGIPCQRGQLLCKLSFITAPLPTNKETVTRILNVIILMLLEVILGRKKVKIESDDKKKGKATLTGTTPFK